MNQKIVIGLIIVMFNFALFEGLARVLLVFKPPLESYHVDFDLKQDMLKKSSKPEQTVIFLGDSLTERSVYSEYLQMMLRANGKHLQILNLATPGATPSISLAMLKSYVQKVGRPKMVVFGATFRAFHRYWQDELVKGENQNETQQKSYFGRCLEDKPRQYNNKLVCSAQKNSILLRYPQMINDALHDLPSYIFETKHMAWATHEDVGNLFFKKGWMPRRDEYKTSQEFWRYQAGRENEFMHYADYFVDADKPDWYSETYMNPLVQYSKQNNIQLVLLIPPTTKSFNTVFYNKALKLPKAQFLARLKKYAQHNQIIYWNLSEKMVSNEATYFNDIVHLNVIGSLAYCELLFNLLKSPVANVNTP